MRSPEVKQKLSDRLGSQNLVLVPALTSYRSALCFVLSVGDTQIYINPFSRNQII